MIDLHFADIDIGREAELERSVTEADVERSVELNGDLHPLHVDARDAAGTESGGPIVRGMLVASWLSGLVGVHLPGRRARLLSADTQFRSPVRVGDSLRMRGRVVGRSEVGSLLTSDVTARNGSDRVVQDEVGVAFTATEIEAAETLGSVFELVASMVAERAQALS